MFCLEGVLVLVCLFVCFLFKRNMLLLFPAANTGGTIPVSDFLGYWVFASFLLPSLPCLTSLFVIAFSSSSVASSCLHSPPSPNPPPHSTRNHSSPAHPGEKGAVARPTLLCVWPQAAEVSGQGCGQEKGGGGWHRTRVTRRNPRRVLKKGGGVKMEQQKRCREAGNKFKKGGCGPLAYLAMGRNSLNSGGSSSSLYSLSEKYSLRTRQFACTCTRSVSM